MLALKKEGEQMNKAQNLLALGAIVAVSMVNPYFSFAEKTTLHAFDQKACYANCGCDAVHMVAACFACKQECDRRFWAEFDREMGTVNKGTQDEGTTDEDKFDQ